MNSAACDCGCGLPSTRPSSYWASSIQESVNPFDFRKEYAISAFDLKHNFVFSYNYDLPIDKLLRASNRLTQASETALEFRFETFNTFNHAQFDGAGSVDGNRDDATFGQILKSQPGRISQVALKLQF